MEAEEGHELSYMRVERRVPALLRSAQRLFGSWSAAVEAAGFNYDEIRRYREWTRERVIGRIQELWEQGADLSWRNVSLNLDPPLAAAALHAGRFPSWNDALTAAGVDPEIVRRYRKWSKSKIQQELFSLAEQGHQLDQETLMETSPALVAAIYRLGSGLVTEREEIYHRLPERRMSKTNDSWADEQLVLPILG
jgi:hypothetical protein